MEFTVFQQIAIGVITSGITGVAAWTASAVFARWKQSNAIAESVASLYCASYPKDRSLVTDWDRLFIFQRAGALYITSEETFTKTLELIQNKGFTVVRMGGLSGMGLLRFVRFCVEYNIDYSKPNYAWMSDYQKVALMSEFVAEPPPIPSYT